jgi:Cu/Ag efflux protein CusF
MRRSFRIVPFALLVLSSLALAQAPAAPTQKPHYSHSKTKTVRATVEAIDQATRTVTLKGEDGSTSTFHAGPEVRNLAQVKVGDEVITQYQEAVAVFVNKPGETKAPLPPPTTGEATTRAELGEKPAGAVAKGTTVTATVEAVDVATRHVTLKGPKGDTVTMQVKDPKYLEGVKPGDQVTAQYTEALAIAVQPAGPKMPAPKPKSGTTK